jgi:cell surface protein SprA
MTMSQRSPVDKYRIGDEPVSNTIYGFDGNMQFEPEWLTRAIDRLPLIQTRAAEFDPAVRRIRPAPPGRNADIRVPAYPPRSPARWPRLQDDELAGVSYIDDFEGFANTFSLRSPNLWQIASAPQSTRPVPKEQQGPRVRLAAYELARDDRLVPAQLEHHSASRWRSERPCDGHRIDAGVYPSRDRGGSLAENTISTLDVYFDPQERGMYNYTRDLAGFLENPRMRGAR